MYYVCRIVLETQESWDKANIEPNHRTNLTTFTFHHLVFPLFDTACERLTKVDKSKNKKKTERMCKHKEEIITTKY